MARKFKAPVIVSSRLLSTINRMDPEFWVYMQYVATKMHTTLDDGSFDFVLNAAEKEIISVHYEARHLRQQAEWLMDSARSLERQYPKEMLTPAGRKRLFRELNDYAQDETDG